MNLRTRELGLENERNDPEGFDGRLEKASGSAETLALRPAVFLDRDGVLNAERSDFIKCPAELKIFPFVGRSIARLNQAGYAVVVVSNQSGLARGLFSTEDLAAMERKLRRNVDRAGGHIEGFYYCPHLPQAGCQCRKPAPGMLLQAARELRLDLARSFMIGDRPHDIQAGAEAGCRTVLVLTGRTSCADLKEFGVLPGAVCTTLASAVEGILAGPFAGDRS
ncbi:MAG: D-glycero-beta-D-manno-heptose 1,7-bisphosphate 7-phosphatase [Chthonomonadales bacterium]